MSDNTLRMLETSSTRTNGRLLVRVPWEHAERFQEFFRAQGIGSTAHLDSANQEACLEPWTNLSDERVRALLDEVPHSHSRR